MLSGKTTRRTVEIKVMEIEEKIAKLFNTKIENVVVEDNSVNIYNKDKIECPIDIYLNPGLLYFLFNDVYIDGDTIDNLYIEDDKITIEIVKVVLKTTDDKKITKIKEKTQFNTKSYQVPTILSVSSEKGDE